MVIAALVCFAILLVAWILAPEKPTAAVQEVALAETQPLAA